VTVVAIADIENATRFPKTDRIGGISSKIQTI
jgi:hypothetical protein